uniref:Secreted protein n=1 Tax=Populus trichocarpa TaxID=3694 RepID=A9PG16_POPTR|nr:unknown [Populus trichocarpa]
MVFSCFLSSTLSLATLSLCFKAGTTVTRLHVHGMELPVDLLEQTILTLVSPAYLSQIVSFLVQFQPILA